MNDAEVLLRFLCYKQVINRKEFLEYKDMLLKQKNEEDKEERVRHY